jgi:hypothetical protein
MNTKTTLKAVTIALAFGGGNAMAADWQAAGIAGERLAVYVDAAAGQRVNVGVIRVDALEDFGRVQFLDGQSQGHRSRASTLIVDCGSRQVGFDAWRLHEGARGEGKVVSRWESQGRIAMFQPVPGSSQARVLERSCSGPVVAAAE